MDIFLFFKMAAGRHLGFCYISKMTSRHVVDCPFLQSAKFGDNSSNGGRVIAIFRLSKWRPAAILDFVGFYFQTTHEV